MGRYPVRNARFFERHREIVADQLDRIEAALAAATMAGVRDPTAVVVDLLEGVGILVAEGLGMDPWRSTLPGRHVAGRVRDLHVIAPPRRRVVAALHRIRPLVADDVELRAMWSARWWSWPRATPRSSCWTRTIRPATRRPDAVVSISIPRENARVQASVPPEKPVPAAILAVGAGPRTSLRPAPGSTVRRRVDRRARVVAAAIAFVSRRFPGVPLLATPRSRVPHDGIADAVCVAEYGRRLLVGARGGRRVSDTRRINSRAPPPLGSSPGINHTRPIRGPIRADRECHGPRPAPRGDATPDRTECYNSTLAAGADEGAVFVLDVRDPTAREIAERSAGGPDAVAAYLRAAAHAGLEPVTTWGVPRTLMADQFNPESEVARCVAVPLEGTHFWVVVVADGSATVVMQPVPGQTRRAGNQMSPLAADGAPIAGGVSESRHATPAAESTITAGDAGAMTSVGSGESPVVQGSSSDPSEDSSFDLRDRDTCQEISR